MNLSARKKLENLEAINEFFNKVTPAESKEIDKKLKKKGY